MGVTGQFMLCLGMDLGVSIENIRIAACNEFGAALNCSELTSVLVNA